MTWTIFVLALWFINPTSLFAQREIPYLTIDELPEIDGDISDWTTLFETPFLIQSDFTSIICPRNYAVVEDGQEREFLVPWASHGPDNQRLQCSVSHEDQQVEVWLGWNQQTNLIYVAARVQDDAFGTNSSIGDVKLVWKSDDIELFIDSDNSGGAYDSTNAHAQQYVLNPMRQKAVLLTLAVTNPQLFSSSPHVLSGSRIDGSEYIYEMAVPGWDILDSLGIGTRHDFQRGQIIGLTVGFGDFDSHVDADAKANLYSAYNMLGGKPDAYKDADAFSDFTLAGPSSDFNKDTVVDFSDFFMFADAFGQSVQGESEKYDLDLSGVVDFSDFFAFADEFQKGN
jgi:hypothetical protein